MKKGKKVFLSVLVTGSLVSGMGFITQAAVERSTTAYSTNIKKLTDFESANKVKSSTDSCAINTVSSTGGSLSSWIENTSGTNITSKVNYNTSGTYNMQYTNTNATAYKGKSVRLNIST